MQQNYCNEKWALLVNYTKIRLPKTSWKKTFHRHARSSNSCTDQKHFRIHFIQIKIQISYCPIILLDKVGRTNQKSRFPFKFRTENVYNIYNTTRWMICGRKKKRSYLMGSLLYSSKVMDFILVLNLFSFNKCIYKSIKNMCLIIRSIFLAMIIAK